MDMLHLLLLTEKIKLANIDTINKIGTKLKLMLFPWRGNYAWNVC